MITKARRNTMKKYQSDIKRMSAMYLILAVLLTVVSVQMNVVVALDEMGTVSNAAYLAGYNWAPGVSAVGGYYYKYGTCFLYYPLFLFIKDSFLLYKAMLAVNAILVSSVSVLCYIICRRHLKMPSKAIATGISVAVTVIPAVLIYTNAARADFVLIFVPWFVLLFLLEAYEFRNKKSVQILFSVLAAGAAVYGYMSHTRGIVFVIAIVMVVLFGRVVSKERIVYMPVFFPALGVFLILDKIATKLFKERIWPNGVGHASMEVINLELIKEIFTPQGVTIAIKTLVGWCYSFFTSTAGLGCLAMIGIISLFIAYLRKKHDITTKEMVLSLFTALVFLGSLAMGILFFFPYIKNTYLGISVIRADRMIYDRYLVNAMGPMVLLGVYFLVYQKKIMTRRLQFVSVGVMGATVLAFVFGVVKDLEGKSLIIKNVISLGVFLDSENGKTTAIYSNMKEAFIAAGVVAFLLLLIVVILSACKKYQIAIGVVIVYFVITSGVLFYKFRYPEDARNLTKIENVVEVLEECRDKVEKHPVVLINHSTAKGAKYYQIPLYDYQLYKYNSKNKKSFTDYLLITTVGEIDFTTSADDVYRFTNMDYSETATNVVYVKGNTLKEELELLGFTFEKVETPAN